MFIKYIIYFILFFLVFRLIFKVLLPVSFAAKQIRKNMEALKKEQEKMAKQQKANYSNINTKPKNNNEDFIEYEEIK